MGEQKGTCMQVTGGSPLAELRSQRKSPPLGRSWCLVPSRQELEETGNPAESQLRPCLSWSQRSVMCEAGWGKGCRFGGGGEWGGDLVPEQGCVLQSLVWLWGPWHSRSPGAEAEQLRPRVWMPPSQGAEQADQGPHRFQTLDTDRKSQVHRHRPRKDVAGDGAWEGLELCGVQGLN